LSQLNDYMSILWQKDGLCGSSLSKLRKMKDPGRNVRATQNITKYTLGFHTNITSGDVKSCS
jgi:hypothetical protein